MNKVIDKEKANQYIWGENCDSWIFSDSKNLSIKLEKMPSGTKEKLHFHINSQQFFYILKGEATFYLNNIIQIVKENQGLLIEPRTKHFVANETHLEIEFLVISQPSTNNDRIEL